LDPEDIKILGLRAIWNLVKEQGYPELISDYGAHKGLSIRTRCIGTVRV
jgi:hypothetical protein